MDFHKSPLLQLFRYIKSLKISDLLPEDITFAEYIMLRMIIEIEMERNNTQVWESDIVKRVEITPQAVSKCIHLAIKKGYIERFENANDRRSNGIGITDHGRSVLNTTEECLANFYNDVLEEFSEDEKVTMHRLLIKLQKVTQISYLKNKKK